MEDNIRLEDMFEVVIQPEHAKGVLRDLQNKYNMSTFEFLSFYNEGIIPIPSKDADRWLFQLNLFLAAEGDLGELIDGRYIGDNCNTDPLNDFYDTPCTNIGQPENTEEVTVTSSFCFLFS